MANEDSEKDLLMDFDFLEKLIVGIGEVSQITGVPKRKIRYWEKKGIVQSIEGQESNTRRFDYLNIKKIILIQDLLEEGYTLDASAEKVSQRIDRLNKIFNQLKSG